MEIHQSETSPWLIIALLSLVIIGVAGIGLLGWAGAFGIGDNPEHVARAQAIEMEAERDDQLKAVEIRKAEALAALDVAKAIETYPEKVRLTKIFYAAIGIGVLLLLALAAMLTIAGGYQQIRISQAPLVRSAGPFIQIIESRDGPILFDLITGRSAMLKDPGEVSEIRAQVIERIEIAGLMAKAREPKMAVISGGSNDDRNVVVRQFQGSDSYEGPTSSRVLQQEVWPDTE